MPAAADTKANIAKFLNIAAVCVHVVIVSGIVLTIIIIYAIRIAIENEINKG